MKNKSIKIIINMDDTGNHPETVNAAIELKAKHRISSVSLMAYGPDFENTVELLKKHRIPTGVHLGAHHGSPVLPAAEVPSLCDSSGNFYDELEPTLEAYALPEVEKELCAQIEKVLDADVTPTHLDSHMGLVYHKPDLCELYIKLAKKYSLSASLPGLSFFTKFKRSIRKFGKMTNDSFQMEYDLADGHESLPFSGRLQQYEEILKNLKPGVHYFATHPIIPTAEVAQIFGDTPIRRADYEFFSSDQWPALLEKYGIELTSF